MGEDRGQHIHRCCSPLVFSCLNYGCCKGWVEKQCCWKSLGLGIKPLLVLLLAIAARLMRLAGGCWEDGAMQHPIVTGSQFTVAQGEGQAARTGCSEGGKKGCDLCMNYTNFHGPTQSFRFLPVSL